MNTVSRVSSIDIMRGLTLLLMLFVNDLYMPGVPAWLGHMPADFDGMGLADWVFPGFLFMVGMSIPYSVGKRMLRNEGSLKISFHIITRTISLLMIGVLMLNSGRVNEEMTGISRNLWAVLMYLSVFMIWNSYKPDKGNSMIVRILKLTGIAILVLLVFIFRTGEETDKGWLITGWWGILGLIGWGYLVAAFVHMILRENIVATFVAFIVFLGFNILSGLGLTAFLDPARPVLGVVIDGNVPMLVLAGLCVSLIIRQPETEKTGTRIMYIVLAGIASIAAGFFLRKWFIISKIQATPSWGLICTGISVMLFAFLYWLTDVRKKDKWAFFLRPSGENSLTTYIAPSLIYHIIWGLGLPILFYKKAEIPAVVIAGSVIWTLLMAGLTALLARVNIKLRL